jgi:hypothetical protein
MIDYSSDPLSLPIIVCTVSPLISSSQLQSHVDFPVLSFSIPSLLVLAQLIWIDIDFMETPGLQTASRLSINVRLLGSVRHN